MRHTEASKKTRRAAATGIKLVVATTCLFSGLACVAAVASADDGSPPAASHHRNPHSLASRVQALSRALDLDANQQVELGKVLERQRDQLEKIWGDASMAPAYRVVATRVISERTSDEIRALLTEEQRQKYKAPRRPDAGGSAARPNVEDWMNQKARPAAVPVSQ